MLYPEVGFTHRTKKMVKVAIIWVHMPSRRVIGAGGIAVLVFAYSVFVSKNPLGGFIAATALVDVALAYAYLDEHGHLPAVWESLENPRSLGVGPLALAVVGSLAILTYVILITRNPLTSLFALSVFWVAVILATAPPPNPFPK